MLLRTYLVNDPSLIQFMVPIGDPTLLSSHETLTVVNYTGAGGIIGLDTRLDTDGSRSDRLVINGGTATGHRAGIFLGGALVLILAADRQSQGAGAASPAARRGAESLASLVCHRIDLNAMASQRRSPAPAFRRKIVGPCSAHCGLIPLVVVHASHTKLVGASKKRLGRAGPRDFVTYQPFAPIPTWLENRGAVFKNLLRAIA
ncbi:hypothetical protein CI1B_32460 [Bradyrhizobium ivorense]|uniref:Autochaperone domain-containing protein n=1 Tax=Bradyrhizobium ivorense TaxID=2511166 RepID=A0A508T5C2_9BRAD|nr:hypothetical protein CI1B_32460 [Bradyrhizobium ivorense]